MSVERCSATPEIGERILANVDTYVEIAAIVRHHHERVDGQGTRTGSPAADIPLLSRIIAVADAYNAMTSDRPYRDAMPSRVARLRLAQAVETQFDTTVVAAFEAILAGADEDYRCARGPGFELTKTVAAAAEELPFREKRWRVCTPAGGIETPLRRVSGRQASQGRDGRELSSSIPRCKAPWQSRGCEDLA